MGCYLSKKLLLIFFVMSLYSQLYAEQAGNRDSIDARVDRLERLMNSQKQLELLYRVKQIRQENQKLRGLLEKQTNEVHLLKQREKNHYADLNRRMDALEKGRKNTSNKIEVIDKSVPIVKSVPKKIQPPIRPKKQAESKKDQQTEQQAYQQAYNELIAHQYNKASGSFKQFVQDYSNSRYAHIAQYWIAEASYAQRNYEQAIIDYQLLLDHYSFSPKKAEAELKKAYCYYELSNKNKAREILQSLLKTYPDTTESIQAKHLLKKL